MLYLGFISSSHVYVSTWLIPPGYKLSLADNLRHFMIAAVLGGYHVLSMMHCKMHLIDHQEIFSLHRARPGLLFIGMC